MRPRRVVVIVASAGNDGSDQPHYPSDYPEVISVVALSQRGDGPGSFASNGVGIDLGAPGSQVFTTLLPEPNQEGIYADSVLYGRRGGSSVAAPMVAATAALLRSVNPALTPDAIRGILTGTAIDLREPGWDERTAAGRLDVAGALGLPFPTLVEITSPEHESGNAATDEIRITGSVLAPQFVSYQLFYAVGE